MGKGIDLNENIRQLNRADCPEQGPACRPNFRALAKRLEFGNPQAVFAQADVTGGDRGVERGDLGGQCRPVIAEIALKGLGQCLRAGEAALVFEPLRRRHQLIGKTAVLNAVYAARGAIAQ
jgi:hypothetical protein